MICQSLLLHYWDLNVVSSIEVIKYLGLESPNLSPKELGTERLPLMFFDHGRLEYLIFNISLSHVPM